MPGQDYPDLMPNPHLTLKFSRGRELEGDFSWGAAEGQLFGKIEDAETASPWALCSFQGNDEGDDITGIITARLEATDKLVGEWRIHAGDTFGIVAERASPPIERRRPSRPSRVRPEPQPCGPRRRLRGLGCAREAHSPRPRARVRDRRESRDVPYARLRQRAWQVASRRARVRPTPILASTSKRSARRTRCIPRPSWTPSRFSRSSPKGRMRRSSSRSAKRLCARQVFSLRSTWSSWRTKSSGTTSLG